MNLVLKRIFQLVSPTLAFVSFAYAASDPLLPSNSLYDVVQLCKQTQLTVGNPFPCLKVQLADGSEPGFAVVPIPWTAAVLLVPTRRISGIESPELLSQASPNWWTFSWRAREFLVERKQGLVARNDIALAVNSREARTQNQLHIHVACIDEHIAMRLRPFERAITHTWSTFPLRLGNERWLAMRVEEEDFDKNPFTLLAALDLASRGPMGDWGIAVLAWRFTDGSDGFLIFATRYSRALAGGGAGVALLDPNCAIATKGH